MSKTKTSNEFKECEWKEFCIGKNLDPYSDKAYEKCKKPFLLNKMNDTILYCSEILGVFIFIIGIFVAIIWYCLAKIFNIIRLHINANKAKKKRASVLPSNVMPSLNINSSANDDEPNVKANISAPGGDAQTRISDDDFFKMNINKRIALYKDYNTKMQTFYMKNRPNAPVQDAIIDNDIFDDEMDNYGAGPVKPQYVLP